MRTTKTALIVILLILSVAGRHKSTWPFIHWTMYSRSIIDYPEDTVSSYQLRVVSQSGDHYSLVATDLIPVDRHTFVNAVIKNSLVGISPVARDQYRVYLSRLVKRALPRVPLKTIQIWELTWQVDPLALPPLDIEHPNYEVLKGSFSL